MKIPYQLMHDLQGSAARITAILSLASDPQAASEFGEPRLRKDMRQAIETLARLWEQADPNKNSATKERDEDEKENG